MNLRVQRKLAASVMRVAPKRVRLDPAHAAELKDAITKRDIRGLIGAGLISALPARRPSRVRARKLARQRAKGLRKGFGSRKGSPNSRLPDKQVWMRRIRAQRTYLLGLKAAQRISKATFTDVYRKAKGGFFRSRRHIKIFLSEHALLK